MCEKCDPKFIMATISANQLYDYIENVVKNEALLNLSIREIKEQITHDFFSNCEMLNGNLQPLKAEGVVLQ